MDGVGDDGCCGRPSGVGACVMGVRGDLFSVALLAMPVFIGMRPERLAPVVLSAIMTVVTLVFVSQLAVTAIVVCAMHQNPELCWCWLHGFSMHLGWCFHSSGDGCSHTVGRGQVFLCFCLLLRMFRPGYCLRCSLLWPRAAPGRLASSAIILSRVHPSMLSSRRPPGTRVATR